MSFNLGLKAIRRLCEEQSPLLWHKAKLSEPLFKPHEQPVYLWVDKHVRAHHALPKPETLALQFPEMKEVEVPEPPSYYVKLLENQYFYGLINQANIDSQSVLKDDKDAHDKALSILQKTLNTITLQKYRTRIVDVAKEAPSIVLTAYHNILTAEDIVEMGWPTVDKSGGLMPGEIASIVGRPAMGKTWQVLYCALHNWRVKKMNALLVSMEMAPLAICQRVTSMYAHTNIGQLKVGGYSSQTYSKFTQGLMAMTKEDAKFYVVDGNLAACPEDIYVLADQLKCPVVLIDGAYLLRNKNPKLDRFMRVADNVEGMKRYSTDLELATIASWQFNRQGSQKNKKKGEEVGLEDIGYSDAIGQISSIALGLFQDEGVETMKQRLVRILKGRNGETGQFSIKWDFASMRFEEVGHEEEEEKELQFI